MLIRGIGGHSGQTVILDVQTSQEPGIWFTLPQGRVRACVDSLISTNMSTTIKQGEAYVSTIEHFLSACAALNLHQLNVIVLEGTELPLMDGSALDFYATLSALKAEKSFSLPTVYVDKTITVDNERGWIEFSPHHELIFDVTVDDPFPKQQFLFNVAHDNYQREIAPARTFGFHKDKERLKEQGLALGADLTNTIVLSDDGSVLNPEGLRCPEELARHKILDALGDLALAEAKITGFYRAVNPSHTLTTDLLRRIKASTPTSV